MRLAGWENGAAYAVPAQADGGEVWLAIRNLPNLSLAIDPSLGNHTMASFLSLPAGKRRRYAPVVTESYLQTAGYSRAQAQTIHQHLSRQNTLADIDA